MIAIVAGLRDCGIQELRITWEHVSRRRQFERLPEKNELADDWRGLLSSVYVSCVPLIDLYLEDIQWCDAQVPEPTTSVAERPFVHSGKRMKWDVAAEAILLHQTKPYTFVKVSEHPLSRRAERFSHSTLAQDPATMAYIDSQLAAAETVDESELWVRSQQLREYEIEKAEALEDMRIANIDAELEDVDIWEGLQVSEIQEDKFDNDSIWQEPGVPTF
jgi:hypothetical protein